MDLEPRLRSCLDYNLVNDLGNIRKIVMMINVVSLARHLSVALYCRIFTY